MPEIWEKVIHRGNLCYHAVDERIRNQEQNLWGIFLGPKGPKPSVDCGGQGCRLTPFYTDCIIIVRPTRRTVSRILAFTSGPDDWQALLADPVKALAVRLLRPDVGVLLGGG